MQYFDLIKKNQDKICGDNLNAYLEQKALLKMIEVYITISNSRVRKQNNLYLQN